VLDAIERVGQIAANKRLRSVMLDYETDHTYVLLLGEHFGELESGALGG